MRTVRQLLPLLIVFAATQASAQEAKPPPPHPLLKLEPVTDLRQVQMHVWISETSDQGLRNLGTNLNYKRIIDGEENSSNSLQQIVTNVFDPLDLDFGVTLPAPDPTMFAPPLRPDQDESLGGIQTQSGLGLNFSLIEDNSGTINGVFRALERSADVDLISKPELLVINGMEAEIHAGGKVPYQSIKDDGKGNIQLNVAFRNVGVNMKITPTILSDDTVKLDINQLDVTDVARFERSSGVDLPVFSTRSQTGPVIVPEGQTLVIGGLSTRVTRMSERRVPIIGRIPLIGILFRGRESESINTNLMIFVAPTVVDLRAMSRKSLSALDFWREGSWKNRAEIEEEIVIMQDEP